MAEWLKLLGYALRSRFKSRAMLEAENLVLRQQINILVRRLPKRVRPTNSDRLLCSAKNLYGDITGRLSLVPREMQIWRDRRGFTANHAENL